MIKLITLYEKIYDFFFDFVEKYFWLFFLLLTSFIAFLCFHNLGAATVANWDESRHGVSAYEMLKNNEYIINTYNYSNDYWNLKPPISFWGILLSFKLFGVSIFSFRFCSALALLLTGILLAIFVYKKYGKLESLITLATFSITSHFYLDHMGRNGDADALFMLFFTLAMLCMLLIDKKVYSLYLCGLFFSLAFLTKSWHAFAIVAIGGLFLIFTGEIAKFKIKQWIIFILSFVTPIGAWAIARIIKDGPKFLIEMVEYDLLARSGSPLEGHTGTVWFYFDYILSNSKFLIIFMFIIILIGLGFYHSSYKSRKNDVIGFLLWITVPFALFTKAETKIFWYIIPVLIPIVAISSIFLGRFIREKSIPVLLRSLMVLTFALCFAYYGVSMIKTVNTVNPNTLQVFMLENFKNNSNIEGRNAYIEIENGNWDQNQLFVAEISGDLKCINGGTVDFLNSTDNSLLIISKEKYSEFKDILIEMNIILQNDEFYLLEKK